MPVNCVSKVGQERGGEGRAGGLEFPLCPLVPGSAQLLQDQLPPPPDLCGPVSCRIWCCCLGPLVSDWLSENLSLPAGLTNFGDNAGDGE